MLQLSLSWVPNVSNSWSVVMTLIVLDTFNIIYVLLTSHNCNGRDLHLCYKLMPLLYLQLVWFSFCQLDRLSIFVSWRLQNCFEYFILIKADMEFVKCFTQVRFPTFLILPEKRVSRNIFGKEIKNEVVLLIHFEQIASFLQLSISIQTQYSYKY